MSNDSDLNNAFLVPDLRYLQEVEAKKRGFDFNNPEDAREIFGLLEQKEKKIEDIKRYFKRIPKTKKKMVALMLTSKEFPMGKKMKKLLNRLKLGIKTEKELITYIYSDSHSSYKNFNTSAKSLSELVRATNKKLYQMEKGLVVINPVKKHDDNAYHLWISPEAFGFELVE